MLSKATTVAKQDKSMKASENLYKKRTIVYARINLYCSGIGPNIQHLNFVKEARLFEAGFCSDSANAMCNVYRRVWPSVCCIEISDKPLKNISLLLLNLICITDII